MSQERCVVLFTKPASPGRVKTRLIGELSAEEAAELHAAFVGDVVEAIAGGPYRLEVAWALEDGATPQGSLLPVPLPGFVQSGADLGSRLFHALERVASASQWVAAVGSDHPRLSRPRVVEAFERLERGAEVVLGPAADGGYYLIALGASRLDPRLFEGVPWSTDQVLERTLERCRQLGLAVELLPEEEDVDRPEDLARLATALAASERAAASAPRTVELLNRWGRLDS